jgi:hypothetical protein
MEYGSNETSIPDPEIYFGGKKKKNPNKQTTKQTFVAR